MAVFHTSHQSYNSTRATVWGYGIVSYAYRTIPKSRMSNGQMCRSIGQFISKYIEKDRHPCFVSSRLHECSHSGPNRISQTNVLSTVPRGQETRGQLFGGIPVTYWTQCPPTLNESIIYWRWCRPPKLGNIIPHPAHHALCPKDLDSKIPKVRLPTSPNCLARNTNPGPHISNRRPQSMQHLMKGRPFIFVHKLYVYMGPYERWLQNIEGGNIIQYGTRITPNSWHL